MMKTSKMRGLLIATLAAASAPALAFQPGVIQPFTADYQVYFQGAPQGSGQMTLAAAGDNRWKYSLNIKGTSGMAAIAGADIAQSTVFEEKNGHWRPLSGTDSNKVLFKKTNKAATYDWSRGVANWTGDVKPERAGPVKLQAGDMDGMLINLALVRDVAAGKPLKYRMVDDGRVKQMSYAVAGKEQITVDGKSQQATRVVSNNGNKQTVAWVVEGLPVPARILQRDKGEDALDLRVKSVH